MARPVRSCWTSRSEQRERLAQEPREPFLVALFRLGWVIKRQSGSHRTLSRPGRPDFVFAFHDGEELGPRMLARVAKHTGLTANDL